MGREVELEDVVAGEDAPDVTLAHVRGRGALVAGEVGGGVDHLGVVAGEVGAGGAAFAGGDQLGVAAGGGDHDDLVAGVFFAGGLENQTLRVIGEVGLGVLATVGEHGHRAEVDLAGVGVVSTGEIGGQGEGCGHQRRSGDQE